MQTDKNLKIWILAGETSGDDIGAKLMKSLRKQHPHITFFGVGGSQMKKQGQLQLFPMDELAVMGFIEVLPKLYKLLRLLTQAKESIRTLNPHVVVTIDSPAFSLRLLKKLKHMGIKRVHYVAPQVWAWHENRVKKFPGLWDKLLCLFPFEKDFFLKWKLNSSFVGHPVLENNTQAGNTNAFKEKYNISTKQPILLLMPGSRRSELPKLLPIFEKTFFLLRLKLSELIAIIPTSPLAEKKVKHLVQNWPIQPLIISDASDKLDAYTVADIALTKSGTSTLELALFKTPMVVAYRVNMLTAIIAKKLIKVPFVCIVNLLAGREIVPELLQERCKPSVLADTLYNIMMDDRLKLCQYEGFAEVIQTLQAPGNNSPSEAAAHEIMTIIKSC
ncbi:Lipid-A-disaccharide synthase [Commensalibacter sp. Nvir]|uniref:lipid-A-disaccharide synthase n=1 Tax=Commensalibacter sp. Nvir TaxID=3069817 RepID=UPI002D53B844|nr:Lipid-A-disaccharide synthase [Commensalibacter sp. Nvir]